MTRLLLPAIALAVLYALACDPGPPCYDGAWPPDGETGVAPDTPLAITFGDAPDRYPALAPGVTLVDETLGEPVAFTTTIVDRVIRVLPMSPLRDGHVYALGGVDLRALDWSNVSERAIEWSGFQRNTARFTVGGQPGLRAAWYDSLTVNVVFTEPMDPADGWLTVARADPTADEASPVPLGPATWSADGRSVAFLLTDELDDDTVTLAIAEGLTTARGAPLAAVDDVLALDAYNTLDPRRALTGAPYCQLR
jgi:hypothetical protein